MCVELSTIVCGEKAINCIMRELFHSNAQQELQEIKALFESSETMDAIAKKLQARHQSKEG